MSTEPRYHLISTFDGRPGIMLSVQELFDTPIRCTYIALLPKKIEDYPSSIKLEWWVVSEKRDTVTVMPSGLYTYETVLPFAVKEEQIPKPKGGPRGSKWVWRYGEWVNIPKGYLM